MKKRNVIQKLLIVIGLFLLPGSSAFAQNLGPAVEHWRSFLPYFQVNAIAHNDDYQMLYCATDYGFFTYNRQDGSLESYSKVNGMHDIGMSNVTYDSHTGSVVLSYTDGNIDIFKNHEFYNIPDLINSNISGNKSIYSATAADGTAYLATGIGLVLVNIPQKEIKFTVSFYSGSLAATVTDVILQNHKVYAATSVGLFETNTDNNFMQDYSSWDKLSALPFEHICFANQKLYAAIGDSVYVFQQADSSFHLFYNAGQTVTHLDAGDSGIWVSSHESGAQGHSYLIDTQGAQTDSLPCRAPAQVLTTPGGEIWYADNSNYHFPRHNGLRKKISATESESYTPDGPISAISYDISAYDGTIWVAHGGYNSNTWTGLEQKTMFSVFKDGHWKNFNWLSDNSWVQDFCNILYDPQNGHTYAGSFTGGLVDVAPDQTFQVYNAGYFPDMYGNPGLYSVSGLALDASGNLWMNSYSGGNELTVKTADGHWYTMPGVSGNSGWTIPHTAANVIVDDFGQLWFLAPPSNGVVVYNPNGTPANTADDHYRILKKGKGSGNLPSNQALCLAKTKDGTIWIGTADGIGIVNCPGIVIDHQCEADLQVVQFDEFADYLFARQPVNAIAVDAANRKWVGTDNGVWLLNTDGSKIKTIYRFTEDNSPLPSNKIRKINIDPITGDVYFSTDKGFVAFRSTATQAPENPTASNLLVYPNPVPSGYEGMVAVKGLPDDADVRFTDITGKLVYRTTAFGGQAVWNVKDYTGHKVQSGVYLVFVVSKDGTKKMTTKIMVQK